MNRYPNVIKGAFRRGVLVRMLGAIQAWNARRVAARHLYGLTDRLLEDIGIDRHQIDLAVRQPAKRTRIAARKIQSVQDTADIRRAA